MENKYYTLDEEDLRIGLEYESLEDEQSGEWSTYTIRNLFDLEDLAIYERNGSGNRRIKYLDRSDIEELGWTFKVEFNRKYTYGGKYPTTQEYEYGDVWRDAEAGWIVFNIEDYTVKITTIDPGLTQDGPKNSVKFCGKVRNKSELRRILKDHLGLIE